MNMIDDIKDLIYVPGISGYEEEVAALIKKKLGKGVKCSIDNLGNLIVPVSKGKQTVVIMAHMDELGAVITKIEKDGSLRFRKVGGIDDRTLVSRMAQIITSKGIVPGVIGLKPLHLMPDRSETKKTIPADQLLVDVGTRSKKETEKLGIKLLDYFVLKKDFLVMNKKYIAARGMDDRAGCAVLLDIYKRLQKMKTKVGVTLVFSTQEEVGLRGAIAIANTLKPDYIFAVDSLSTTDGPGLPKNMEPVLLGAGPVLRLIDNRAIASPKLKKLLIDISRKKKIPLQLGVTGGSTDGAAVQECGAAMMPVCMAVRYTHSTVEVVHLDDLQNISKILIEVVKTL